MTGKQLEDLAVLNQLSFNEEEQTALLSLFDRMNVCEKALEQYDTTNTQVMVHVLPMTNVLREDKREQPFSRESLLERGPEHTEDSWQVPRLVK